ncbi:predicted protein [Naegleria gruberi]|uniref:Predicted protein n=1 Tax=Naegleria gruberi TaxID=5762 RepID=D2VV03_NAEGR|nr:uncharacterized protein NAEGRDRAFT_52474 [Naegleria gruberi]EFC39411.1 predicted protein [Naegleria gruberi]|eukprot:XP_002672155.1 predicted protein [Naegleria gruberi strain NEG-M]
MSMKGYFSAHHDRRNNVSGNGSMFKLTLAVASIVLIICSGFISAQHQNNKQLAKCHRQLAKNIIFDRVVSLYRNENNSDKITELLELQIASVNKECFGIPLMFNPSDLKAYKVRFSTEVEELKKRETLENAIKELEAVPHCSDIIVEMIIAKQVVSFVENRLQTKDSKVRNSLKETLDKCGQLSVDIFKKLDSGLNKESKLELTELFEVQTIHSSLVTVEQPRAGQVALAQMFSAQTPVVLSLTSAVSILLLAICSILLCLSKRSLKNLRGEIDHLIEDKKETVKKFEEKEVKLLDDIKNLSNSLDEKEKQVSDVRAGLEKTLEAERIKISDLEHEISNSKEGSTEEKKKLLSQLKEKEGIVMQLEEALEQVLNLRQEIEEEKLALQKKSELLDNSLKITAEELEEMNEQYDRVSNELSKKMFDIDLLQQKNIGLQKSLVEGQDECKKVKSVLDTISDKVLALNKEKESIEEDLRYLQMEKQAWQEEKMKLTTQVELLQNRSSFGEGSIVKERYRLVSLMQQIEKAIFLLEKSLLVTLGGIYFERDSEVLTKILELKTFVKEVIQRAERSANKHNQANDVTLPSFDAQSPRRSMNNSLDESFDKISPIRSPTTPRKTVNSPRIK